MANAILTWVANIEADLASYKVYRKVTTAPLTLLATVPKEVTTYTDSPLPVVDGDISYSLTAVDTAGNESPQSVTVTKTVNLVPPVAPVGLVVVLQ